MKTKFRKVGTTVLVLIAGSLLAVSIAQAEPQRFSADDQQGCTDRVTGGGFILPGGQFANFGAHGGLLHGDLGGHLNYVDHNPSSSVRHVTSDSVVAYCIGCVDRDCRRITYSPATVDGVEVSEVIIEVCDKGEPGTNDTFSICIPSRGYCQGGVLGGDNKPSGGNIQLHAADPGCGGTVPICTKLTACPCFPICP